MPSANGNVLFFQRDWIAAPRSVESSADKGSADKNGTDRDGADMDGADKDGTLKGGTKDRRTLVLCFDGGNQFSKENSNVLHFFKCLRKDHRSQIVYYQTGIGTYTDPAFVTKPVIEVSMALDAAIGWNIENHVLDAYRFLMQNHKPGDRISLFGFSRGAYTARVLSGFVQKMGLLPPENHAQIPFAWNIFKGSDDKDSDDKDGIKKCADYKKAFSKVVTVDFIGVWDTVASLGISGKELPFVKPMEGGKDGGVRVFRHAVALDERRAKFMPNFKLAVRSGPPPGTNADDGQTKKKKKEEEELATDKLGAGSREVWFAGCHCDVGGGSVPDTTPNSLARIPLRWMIRECFRMKTGIIFHTEMLQGIGLVTKSLDAGEMKSRGKRLSGKSSPLRESEDKPFSSFLWITVLLLWDPVKGLLFFFFALLAYPLNLIRYSKCFQGSSCIRNCVAQPDLERQSEVSGQSQANERKVLDEEANAAELHSGQQPEAPGQSRVDDDSEEKEEKEDALSPSFDQLSMKRLWWIFEIWPIIFRRQDSWKSRKNFETRVNLGKGREIYGDAWTEIGGQKYIEVHRSVRTRMESDAGYKPRAWFRNRNGREFRWQTEEGREMIRWVE